MMYLMCPIGALDFQFSYLLEAYLDSIPRFSVAELFCKINNAGDRNSHISRPLHEKVIEINERYYWLSSW